METHPFGYITAIVFQQLMIVGLFWGIVQLFHENHHLRRLARFQARLDSTDLNLAGHGIVTPQFQELPPEVTLKSEPSVLSNLRS